MGITFTTNILANLYPIIIYYPIQPYNTGSVIIPSICTNRYNIAINRGSSIPTIILSLNTLTNLHPQITSFGHALTHAQKTTITGIVMISNINSLAINRDGNIIL